MANKIPQELMETAMQCEAAEEILELGKENGVALTKEEAEAFLAEDAVADLDEEALAQVAGGMIPNR